MWSNWLLLLVAVWAVGGTLVGDEAVTDVQILTLSQSPYVVGDEWVVEATGSLVIEAGVVLNFRPGSGITVKGSLVAKVGWNFIYFHSSPWTKQLEINKINKKWEKQKKNWIWRLLWNCTETALRHQWNGLKVALKWLCMDFDKNGRNIENCSETALKQHLGPSGSLKVALKPH